MTRKTSDFSELQKNLSWGRSLSGEQLGYFLRSPEEVSERLQTENATLLAHGLGRSYGDVAINSIGKILCTKDLRHIIKFDRETGVFCAESGISLGEILDVTVPAGWFVPVLPGTKFVSLGGAVANDIHGKNHHSAGTFGNHVLRIGLVRGDGTMVVCSPKQNSEIFYATLGGIGLTGFLAWVEFKLKKVKNSFVLAIHNKMKSIDEFERLTSASDEAFEYTVAWIDTAQKGKNLGRGIFMKANHSSTPKSLPKTRPVLSVPFEFPGFVLNRFAIKQFNNFYYHKQFKNETAAIVPFDRFFFPLDGVRHWNRIYGANGFFQYQFVVPSSEFSCIVRVLEEVSASGLCSFLTVLKKFGSKSSGGLMSFPMAGYTLAMDFMNRGKETTALFDRLDQEVLNSGGRLYLAKDLRMPAEMLKRGYPNLNKFVGLVDGRFSSDLWRRML